MALNFYKQRDIDAMDAKNIPEEFINYFDSLSEERKQEILQSRPDLAEGLGYTTDSKINAAPEVKGNDTNNSVENEDDELAQIRQNRYANVNLDNILVNDLNPVEALIIQKGTTSCPVHRTKFITKTIKYSPKGRIRSTYGVVLHVCKKCKRIFIDESKAQAVRKAFVERNIDHVFYDKDLSNLYLRSQMSEYVLGEDEKIYYPDSWIESDPTCPIHECRLYETKVSRSYKDRKATFQGYYCQQCNKIIVRRAAVSGLLDLCSEKGVPAIETARLVNQEPVKKPIPRREIKPDYFVEDGVRNLYSYKYNADCYRLTEDDTVIVSDSIYCNLDGHQTKEVLVLITVEEKRAGRKSYLVMAGFCSECQKFYMDLDDYKVIHSYGRPAVTILSDIETDFNEITSGEVYNLERTHLKKVDAAIEEEVDRIQSQPDYVGRYQTGYYDDGNLNFAKNLTIERYEPRIKELGTIQPKPYIYRVDISADKETKTYYVGANDLTLDGKQEVISFNSDFGRQLVNYQTTKIKEGNREYRIKLSRQFDIENAKLYSYVNLRTDEDIIFRSGITDPFLVRVLNIRKRQHNLIDILATIQENQNRIVDTEFNQNIVVQGCAGSGKTMVLLHRLSALQYRQRYFDFTVSALILTPNEQFNLHIQGLAEGLQIGNIQRLSVEQYYYDRLLAYSPEFRTETSLVSEMLAPQDYVDYIYSNQFRIDFNRAYENVMIVRNQLSEVLEHLLEGMNEKKSNLDFSNPMVVTQLRTLVESLDLKVKQQEQLLRDSAVNLVKLESSKARTLKKRKEAEETVSGFMQETIPLVYRKIGGYVRERGLRTEEIERQLAEAKEEHEHIQNATFIFGRRSRLASAAGKIEEVQQSLDAARRMATEEDEVLSRSLEGFSNAEYLDWIRQSMKYVPDLQEELNIYNTYVQEVEKSVAEYQEYDEQVKQEQARLIELQSSKYSAEVKRAVRYLLEKTEEYTVSNTFKMIFDQAVHSFKEEHKIGRIIGNWHRYDLYAELIFAMKFFHNANGSTRFMCIDEGQDLAMGEYRLLYELNQHNVIFNIYGDTNQLIKPGRGIYDWTDLERSFKATEFRLNENYRNTNQITKFCNSNFNMNVLRTGVDGPAVREIVRSELESELSGLRITTERVAVLVPRSVQKGRYIRKEELGYGIRDILGDEIGNGRIAVKYVDEVKGIEFDRVYVVGNRMTRNEKYIAYTRALSNLVVVVDDEIQGTEDDSADRQRSAKEQQMPRRSEGSRASNGEGTLKWQQSGRNNGRNKPAEKKEVPRTARTDRVEKPTVPSGLEPVNDTENMIRFLNTLVLRLRVLRS